MIATMPAAMDDESLVPIAEASGWFPKRGSRALGAKAIRKRIRVGEKGVRLEALRDGGEWFTCRAWVERYLEAVTAASLTVVRPAAPPSREAERAKAILSRRWKKHGPKAKAR